MGMPAARVTDMHMCPKVNPGPVPHVGGPVLTPGGPSVIIGGLASATVGSTCFCIGPPDTINSGSGTVLIEGKKAARIGDGTAHGGKIVLGCFTVIVG